MREKIIIRGGGDIASGIIQKFYRAGFKVLVLEIERPSTIRKNVALSQALYDGEAIVEDMHAKKVSNLKEIEECWNNDYIPIVVDESGAYIDLIKPKAVIDAILAKRNLGTFKAMADIVIGIGPGFSAKQDVDAVIETMRGHNLGRVIFEGSALPNTGVPGEIKNHGKTRVVHSKIAGKVKLLSSIGDVVKNGDVILSIDGVEHCANLDGRIRGLIEDGYDVKENFKIADVDPRLDIEWQTISDKARAVGGGALDAYFSLLNKGVK